MNINQQHCSKVMHKTTIIMINKENIISHDEGSEVI